MVHAKIGIIGGGAAGYFLAANLGKLGEETILLEQAKSPLQKVKISGGGRCNVTHACFDPKELVEYYPRGNKELLSVFHRFQPSDTMDWFEQRGVSLKIESDNRVFPESNLSASIINALTNATAQNNVDVRFNQGVKEIKFIDSQFYVTTVKEQFCFDYLTICTGSSNKTWQLIKELGHRIIEPVPSLFTFNCNHPLLQNLAGTAFKNVQVSLEGLNFEEYGDLLITHWGFSGPAVLKLSSRAAIELNKVQYNFKIKIQFTSLNRTEIVNYLYEFKLKNSKREVYKSNPFNEITKRFWQSILELVKVERSMVFAHLNKIQINEIAKVLSEFSFKITGKSTFKDEFVTAGGIDLKEINFKRMESKLIPNLFFAGEVLNIDALTGGFNFQACWSEAFIISESLNEWE